MKKTIFAIFMAGLMLVTVFSSCFTASVAFVGEEAKSVDFIINGGNNDDPIVSFI